MNFSQEKIRGFDLEKNQQSRLAMIGAGAIGSHVGLGLTRKGIGVLDLFDDDLVELKNLTRQIFYRNDVGKNKAACLARHLSRQGFFKTRISGYPYRFQEAVEMGFDFSGYDLVVCGVDNNVTRTAVAGYCLENEIPLVVSGVGRDGNQMYCAVQEPGRACFGCIMPQSVNDDSYPCNLPGIIDIIQVVAGFMVFAVDTVLMERHREWNLRMVSLDGSVPDTSATIEKNKDCPLCGHGRR